MNTYFFFTHMSNGSLFKYAAGWKHTKSVLEATSLNKNAETDSQHLYFKQPLTFNLVVLCSVILFHIDFVCVCLSFPPTVLGLKLWIGNYSQIIQITPVQIFSINKNLITFRNINAKTHSEAAHDINTHTRVWFWWSIL